MHNKKKAGFTSLKIVRREPSQKSQKYFQKDQNVKGDDILVPVSYQEAAPE